MRENVTPISIGDAIKWHPYLPDDTTPGSVIQPTSWVGGASRLRLAD